MANMRNRRVLLSISSLFIAAAAVFLIAPHAKAAIKVCSCNCVDNENVVTQLALPADGSAGHATCTESCNTQFPDQASLLQSAYAKTVALPGGSAQRCGCDYLSQTATVVSRKLSPGQTTCKADCAVACGGSASVASVQKQPNPVAVDCVTDADCAVGSFKNFNPTCEVLPATAAQAATYPNGVPTCVPHLTKESADAECLHDAGPANGGVCDFVAAGDNPKQYQITRPFVNSQGAYSFTPFNNFTFVQGNGGLWNALDAWSPSGGVGACYMYGLMQDIDFSQIQISTSTAIALNQIMHGQTVNLGAAGSKRYVCVKRVQDQCGYIIPPATLNLPIKTKTLYSCISTSLVTNSSSCFPATYRTSVNGAPTPMCSAANTLCCAPGCTTNSDCGQFKMCDTNTKKCIANPVCDPQDATKTCRQASSVEINDPDICSKDIVMQHCQVSGQFCCKKPDTAALSSCALDKRNDPLFSSNGSDWHRYTCTSVSSIPNPPNDPTSEWVTLPNGSTKLKDPTAGGHCITNDVLVGGNTATSRCGQGSACCDSFYVNHAQALAAESARSASGASCGAGAGLTCVDFSSVMTDARAQSMGFGSATEWFNKLVETKYCQITPLSQGWIQYNKQCVANNICCSSFVSTITPCDPSNANACSNGTMCDAQLHICVPGSAVQEQLSSSSCVTRARANNAQDVDTITALNINSGVVKSEEEFGCQSVSNDLPGIANKCLAAGAGCENVNPGANTSGKTMLCCVPGMGDAPTAIAALSASSTGGGIQSAPGALRLPACIQSGNCTLTDIVVTGANFANFLLSISGAVFLAIFVYAGFKYLTAGTSARAAEAKKMIVSSSIGMALLLASFVIVQFIQTSLVSQAAGAGKVSDCGVSSDTKNMTCQYLSASPTDANAISQEVQTKGCKTNHCPGPKNYVCCPQ